MRNDVLKSKKLRHVPSTDLHWAWWITAAKGGLCARPYKRIMLYVCTRLELSKLCTILEPKCQLRTKIVLESSRTIFACADVIRSTL